MTENFVMNTYSRFDAVFEYGKDCYLFDENGKNMLILWAVLLFLLWGTALIN